MRNVRADVRYEPGVGGNMFDILVELRIRIVTVFGAGTSPVVPVAGRG